MSPPALLDVNALIALCDPDHVFHAKAKEWWVTNKRFGWATCPLTQNGCLRITTQPKYTNPQPFTFMTYLLQDFCADGHHAFWADDTSILDPTYFDHTKIHGHRQLTDLYLLALAVKHNGRLVTFDGQIPLSAVRGATKQHLVIL
jgi:toxin-antitoxin system PIN domain toxin